MSTKWKRKNGLTYCPLFIHAIDHFPLKVTLNRCCLVLGTKGGRKDRRVRKSHSREACTH